MPGQPNPKFNLTVNTQGLPPAPVGGGNTPLIIGNTASGSFSGYPGVGLYSIANLPTLTSELGSYGNAVDAAALDFAANAQSVLIYKAFVGTVNSGNWVHTGSGTGTVAVSGNLPLGPYGTATGTGSTGIEIQIESSSNGTIYGTYAYSLDGGATWSAATAIVPTTPQSLGNTGVSVIFTGADTTGVWVASDSYIQPITATNGLMYPYGGSSFTSALRQTNASGSTTVVGEGTFADNSSNPEDNFNVLILITGTGTSAAGTAQYVYSLDGGITFSANQVMPASSAAISLPGGMSLTPADTGGPGGTQAGFVAGEQYRFGTQGPQMTPALVLAIINSLQANPAVWGWIHIPQQCNTVNTSASVGFELATLFTDVEAAIGNLWTAGQYQGAYAMYDGPTDTAAQNIDSTYIAWANGVSGFYSSVGTGNAAATVSPANGWQLPRGSSWDLSARLCSAPLGQDPAWVGRGSLIGVSATNLYRNEANTPGLGPAGFVTLWTVQGEQGVFITNGNLLVASNNDISLSQYRRIINQACATARSSLIGNQSGSVRLTALGTIDPRDIANLENNATAAVNAVLSGQISGANVAIANTLGGAEYNTLMVTITLTTLGYLKNISVTVGLSNPAFAV